MQVGEAEKRGWEGERVRMGGAIWKSEEILSEKFLLMVVTRRNEKDKESLTFNLNLLFSVFLFPSLHVFGEPRERAHVPYQG